MTETVKSVTIENIKRWKQEIEKSKDNFTKVTMTAQIRHIYAGVIFTLLFGENIKDEKIPFFKNGVETRISLGDAV